MVGEIVEVVSTFASREDADRVATELVARRLAACAQIREITSVYRWDGEVCREGEFELTAKTTAARAAAVEEYVAAHHPYDTPAILRLPVLRANEAYAAWVRAETEPGA